MSAAPQVGFDVTPVISGRTGIARYVTQLATSLRDSEVELRTFAVGRSAFSVPPGTHHLRLPARLVLGWWRVCPWPPIERTTGPVDLVHATGLLMPSTRRPLVVTVHDLAALRHPGLLPERQVRQQHALIGVLRTAAAVLTVSRATAQDVVDLGIDAQRVVVAPLGLSPLPQPTELPAGLRPAGDYILTVGETVPRKGYEVLIEALARLGGDLKLVMVGPPGAAEEAIRRRASELGVTARLRRLGAVPDGALASLYAGALALCFPSVAEGFGLPVLEAMAAGTPVLVSDIPVMRELTAGAALYVGHGTGRGWAEAIEGLISAPTSRERLGAAGRLRAAEFTWEKTASATLAAYRLALGAGTASAPG